ncbi:MAG: NADH-quinone oxidoreductase subunit NuoK [candidate division Zixibacteria bacterium]|nr:NADH-quinone oxidoreductase subunit NuoK [candidate division Zixibacteria bacterium]
MVGLNHYLTLSTILFCIGIFGVLTRRNAIGILMSIELMFNAVNINFVAFSKFVTPNDFVGQIFAIFVITIAAAEATVGLAIVLLIYRNFKGINVDNINIMKW